MKAILTYLKARLDERATWLLIGAGIPLAATLNRPWDYVSFIVCVIGALVPGKDNA